tara:strand:+ start:1628 stop:1846 length:219 start_codon:yes stop_codon:yes gene_type:complete
MTKCQHCNEQEADIIRTASCCAKHHKIIQQGFDLDEYYCSKCYGDDETIEMMAISPIHYPIDNMISYCGDIL